MNGTDFSEIVIVLAAILMSMTLHEAIHAFTSHWLGDDTAFLMGRLTFNPLKHIDPFATVLLPILLVIAGLPPFGAAKPVPFNPYRVKGGEFGAALVGIAGPLTNFALAVIAGLWLRFVVGFDAGVITDVFVTFVSVNLSFFVFNMIPFPPLDGSRLLYAFAPEPVQKFMRQIEMGGFMSILVFMFVIFPFIRVPMVDAIVALMQWILGVSVI